MIEKGGSQSCAHLTELIASQILVKMVRGEVLVFGFIGEIRGHEYHDI